MINLRTLTLQSVSKSFKKSTQDDSYRRFICSPRQGCNLSMRWNQFGMILWSKNALPFLGGLLRTLLRDETWEAKSPYVSLKVRRTLDLEILMNVALWKEGATWCRKGLLAFICFVSFSSLTLFPSLFSFAMS